MTSNDTALSRVMARQYWTISNYTNANGNNYRVRLYVSDHLAGLLADGADHDLETACRLALEEAADAE